MILSISKFITFHLLRRRVLFQTTMNNNNNNNNNSLIPTFAQFRNDFCSWIRGHENLYQCLLKIKHFIVNNPVLLFCLLFLYHRFNVRYFILFLYYRFIVRTNY